MTGVHKYILRADALCAVFMDLSRIYGPRVFLIFTTRLILGFFVNLLCVQWCILCIIAASSW